LKKEMWIRSIDHKLLEKFVTEWKVFIWTWEDPKTHEKCSVCWWSGYKWRIWLFEMMDYNDDVKNMILNWKSAFDVEKYALENWMINLERDWMFKVLQWVTTLDEVYRYVKIKMD
jgi:type II secretory ATPase GspE/PulE/Tfp pilus assembly ATPase PilB-like protein